MARSTPNTQRDLFHDPLTGLGNRVLLKARMGYAQHRMAQGRHDARFALLFTNLSGFRLINESLGRDVGDELLIRCGARLQAAIRPTDALVRLEADRFAILLEDIETLEQTQPFMRTIAQWMALPFEIAGHSLLMQGHLGAMIVNHDQGSPSGILREGTACLRPQRTERTPYQA